MYRINFLYVNRTVFATFLLSITHINCSINDMFSVIKYRYKTIKYTTSSIQMVFYDQLQVLIVLDVRDCFRGYNVVVTVRFRLRLDVCDSLKTRLDHTEIIGIVSICLQNFNLLFCNIIYRTYSYTFHFFIIIIVDGTCLNTFNLVEKRSHDLRNLYDEITK